MNKNTKSKFVKYTPKFRKWRNITVCPDCGKRNSYENMHPAHPCPECGGRVVETVGRWEYVEQSFFFGLFTKEIDGRWVARSDQPVERKY